MQKTSEADRLAMMQDSTDMGPGKLHYAALLLTAIVFTILQNFHF